MSGSDYDYSCLMALLPPRVAQDCISLSKTVVEDKDLYDPEGEDTYGRELHPHVTILYGIREGGEAGQRIQRLLGKSHYESLTIKGFGWFEAEDYDVLFLKVDSDDLVRLNQALRDEFPDHHSTHPDYQPHITLAYTQKGVKEDLEGFLSRFELNMKVPLYEFEFSTPNDGDLGLHL